MINIEAAQSYFSSLGLVICALGFLSVFYPPKTKCGILALCLGNIPLWSAIMFAKPLAGFIEGLGINPASDLMIAGIISGLLLFILWMSIFDKISSLFKKSDDNSDDENGDSHDDNSHSAEDEASNSTLLKSKSANPKLFDNLKLCK